MYLYLCIIICVFVYYVLCHQHLDPVLFQEVVVQEVKPSGEETVGGHNKKVCKVFFLFYICLRLLKIVGSYVQQEVNIFVSFVLLCVFCLSLVQTLNMNANYFVSKMQQKSLNQIN